MTITDWNTRSTRLIKSELVKRGIGYAELSERLNNIGINKSPNTIASTISRGAFSFVFFYQCMEAIGACVEVR